jgi:peptidyl-prolyl cis-trans isomerase A (cyclophilin A)
MNKRSFRRVTAFAGLVATFLGFSFSGSAQYTNGIYAEFNTSMGSYTCRLDCVLAPKTCANFIGLTTGQRAWLDLTTGTVKTNPFYNGTTMHRVIAGFVNQGGSRNGQGTDGPGYQFPDEFTPALRHDGFGVLSMANSGPDSNGSQYFITVSPQPGLDDVHSVFGRLYGGSNVVYAINHVTTDTNDKPLTNVVVNSIVIQRIGAAAQAFEIGAQGLAVVTSLSLTIGNAGADVALTFSNAIYADNRFYSSTNLADWTATPRGINIAPPPGNTLLWSTIFPSQFFRMAQIQYPPTLFVPRNVFGKTLTFNFAAGNTIVIMFDNSGGGTYTWTLGSGGNILLNNWVQDPYRGRMVPIIYSGIPPTKLHLHYDTATSGTVKGTGYPNYPLTLGSFSVSGTFTSTP